jgi:hypothetical protein
MAFQPFGYRFEVKSPSPPSAVKAAIRARKKGWFHGKDGARGWIVGPFICLWFSAFDRCGPMVFGRVSRDGLGTRVSGRAGSDLNGVIMISLLYPVMAFSIITMIAEGTASVRQLLAMAVIAGIVIPLIYWWSHKDKREAEPLVRFLRDAVTVRGQNLRRRSSTAAVSKSFTLTVSGEDQDAPVTPDAIHDALIKVAAGQSVILSSGPETYIQTAFCDGGYVLEMREENGEKHFQAVRRGVATTAADSSNTILTFEEVLEAFMAYASEAPLPTSLMWKRMDLAGQI